MSSCEGDSESDEGSRSKSEKVISVLPRNAVQKAMNKLCKKRKSTDAVDVLTDCSTELARLISSTALKYCEKGDKELTMKPEHVTTALKELGLEKFNEKAISCSEEFEIFRKERADSYKIDNRSKSVDELAAEQDALFERELASVQDDPEVFHPDSKIAKVDITLKHSNLQNKFDDEDDYD